MAWGALRAANHWRASIRSAGSVVALEAIEAIGADAMFVRPTRAFADAYSAQAPTHTSTSSSPNSSSSARPPG